MNPSEGAATAHENVFLKLCCIFRLTFLCMNGYTFCFRPYVYPRLQNIPNLIYFDSKNWFYLRYKEAVILHSGVGKYISTLCLLNLMVKI